MNKLKTILGTLALLLTNLSLAFAATCQVNGQDVPCDQVSPWLFAFPVIMVIIFIPLIYFWIKMLIHAIKYQKENKIVWVLVILFLQILGAAIYYFVEKKPADKMLVR